MQVALAHHHMLAVLLSELPSEARSVSILDVGCGDGRMMALLFQGLRAHRPGLEIDIRGFDVSDPGVQKPNFFAATRALLEREVPGVDWADRLELIAARDRWPYPDGSFDWVISNQVLEHVENHEFLLSEIARVLKPSGRSAHLFPVLENVLEGHVHIPCSHWIRDRRHLVRYIRFMTALGIGNFRQQQREDPRLDAARFAESRADYLLHLTNYITTGDLVGIAHRAGLRCSFQYTEHFYWNKLRSLLRRPPELTFRPVEPGALHSILVAALSRISCVTALLEKRPEPSDERREAPSRRPRARSA
jgi:SAM-dependent methyltransferase